VSTLIHEELDAPTYASDSSDWRPSLLNTLRDLTAHKGYANAALLSAICQNGHAAKDPEILSLMQHVLLANRFWLLSCLCQPFVLEEESQGLSSLLGLIIRYRSTQDQEAAWPRVRDSYRDAERRLVGTWGFNQGDQVHFPAQQMTDVFRDGIDSDPSYEGRKEHGFRDVVIYLAVVEHLQRTPAVSVLVSDDKFFPGVGEERERRWREGHGVNLKIIRAPKSQSLEALKRDLEEMQAQRETPERRTWRQQDEERAKTALQAKGEDELRAYIWNRVQIPSTFPYRFEHPEVGSVRVGRGDYDSESSHSRRVSRKTDCHS
jgi:hypothetical protein